jgi:uncharacterized membrane protein YkvA (DUF1232 family)
MSRKAPHLTLKGTAQRRASFLLLRADHGRCALGDAGRRDIFALMPGWLDSVKGWARGIKRDVVALWIAARDPRTPIVAKVAAGAVAAYALSPIDLIPDFVPVLGHVDDLLIVPLGIMVAVRLLPPPSMAEFRAAARAAQSAAPASSPSWRSGCWRS